MTKVAIAKTNAKYRLLQIITFEQKRGHFLFEQDKTDEGGAFFEKHFSAL